MDAEELKEEIEHQRVLQREYRKRLRVLEQQAAKFGDTYVPPHIQIEVNELIRKIGTCEIIIADKGSELLSVSQNNVAPSSDNRDVESKILWKLIVINPNRELYTIQLRDGKHLIGRNPDTTIHLEDAGISRHHAEIICHSNICSIIDLGSAGGVSVNGHRMESGGKLDLQDGDVIEISRFILKARKG